MWADPIHIRRNTNGSAILSRHPSWRCPTAPTPKTCTSFILVVTVTFSITCIRSITSTSNCTIRTSHTFVSTIYWLLHFCDASTNISGSAGYIIIFSGHPRRFGSTTSATLTYTSHVSISTGNMTLSLWITWITSVCIRRIIKWRILLTCHPSRCCSIASASTTCASNFLISTSIYTLTLVLNMIWVAFIGIRSHPSWIAILSWHPGRSCSTPTSPNAATISSSYWGYWMRLIFYFSSFITRS